MQTALSQYRWQSLQKSHSNGILSGRGTASGCFARIAVYGAYSVFGSVGCGVKGSTNDGSTSTLKLNPVDISKQLPQPEMGIRTRGDALHTQNGRSQVPVGSGKRGRA